MNHELTKKRKAIRFRGDRREETSVSLIREAPLTIFLNGRELVTLLCAGHHLEELTLGFLKSEGLLDAMHEVVALQVDQGAGVARVSLKQESALREALFQKRTLGAGCGRASLYYQPLDALQLRPTESRLRVRAQQVRERMRDMTQSAPLYRETRGTHNAALAEAARLLVSREDIGRHNATDMIVGHALREGIAMEDKILLTTGRASSEIVLKAARVGIPILVSRSAPTHLGVEIAHEVGMTLLGAVRGGRMTLYSHPHRIEDYSGSQK
jgi:FdhD protein